jgi:DNA polymerase I-like protein with 3'-5' exonuclease and polymerase domains
VLIQSKEQIQQLIKQLQTELVVAYDIETNSLNPRSGTIIGIAVAGATWEAYIVLKQWVNNELVSIIPYSDLQYLFAELRKKRLIMHNGSFDCRFTQAQTGIDLTKALYADTMLLQHTLNENLFSYGLKDLAERYFGAAAKDEKNALADSIKANGGSKTEYYKADTTVMAKYAMQDVRLTYKLWKLLDPQLDKEGLRPFFYRDEIMPLYKTVTIAMEARGIPVDVPKLQQASAEINADILRIEAEIQAELEPLLAPFNKWYIETKFPYQASAKFFNKLAERIAPEGWPRTDTGSYSFNKLEVTKAIKKKLIPADTALERYAVTKLDRVPELLQQELQMQLFKEETGEHAFSLTSKDHLKRLFFGYGNTKSLLNEKALSHTDKGNPQVDDEFLEIMATKYEWANKLRTFNRLNKIKSTYIDRVLEAQEDGIFYPQFHQHRTVSGRYSGDTQQLPRPLTADEEPNELIRNYNNQIRAFYVSASGWSFADFDYDSQEVKVFAHVSGEQAIKNIFAEGNDFYSSICIMAEGLEGYSANKKADNYLGKVNKAARQRAKAYALGLAFNMSPYKLKFELNCSEEAAQQIYENYFRAFPDLKKWLDSSIQSALQQGYVKTQSGRVRRFPNLVAWYAKYGKALYDGLECWKQYHDSAEIYAYVKSLSKVAKNYLNNSANIQIQGLAASITNRAAIKTAEELKAAGLQGYICNVIHDQITVHCPDTELERCMAILGHCMETAYPISVALPAPPSHGKNFLESK